VSELAVLVCDDSAMARKQLIRVLPPGWSVRISQATNGLEGLQAIREGKGEVVFLDLTMPEMDGYELLAALGQQQLLGDRKIIVVSADVQEDAVARVKALGAVAFIKKPVEAPALVRCLEELQLLPVNHQDGVRRADNTQIPFRDAFREVTNIAMGKAGALLAKVLGVFVELPIPNVNMLEIGELHMALADARDGQHVTAICQGYIGEGISGEALLIFHDSGLSDIGKLMHWKGEGQAAQMEMLLDSASILIGACLNGLTEQWCGQFSVGHPVLLGHGSSIADLIRVNEKRWKRTLAVEISYSLEGHQVHFDLMLLFSEDSVPKLADKIRYLMGE
jgi:CheY-like chemotaxis protein